MNKTDFQAKMIADKITMEAAWPFPTGINTLEVFYENPRNAIKRFRYLKDRDDTIKSFIGTRDTVTTTKPDRDPPRLLSNSTDGVHFRPLDYLAMAKNSVDPSYDQTDNLLLQKIIKDQRKEADPYGKDQNSPGAKVDAGKSRVWLCLAGFSRALREVAKVTTVGANKYTPNGWIDVPDGRDRYMDAFGRHLLDLGSGATIDDGEGGTHCLHKAQMIWNLLASLDLELREQEKNAI